jgi:hypothetical protein
LESECWFNRSFRRELIGRVSVVTESADNWRRINTIRRHKNNTGDCFANTHSHADTYANSNTHSHADTYANSNVLQRAIAMLWQ